MEEIVSLPPMEFFNNDYQAVLDFIEDLGNPKFKIAGDVDLRFNQQVTTLGNLVEVGGNLFLNLSKITSLPENLKVGMYLDIRDTKITSLPDNLYVTKSLILKGTSINRLPNNLHVGDYLNASHLNIDIIPNNLNIGGNINLFMTPLTKKYYKSEIRQMIKEKGGYIGGDIW